MYAAWGTLYQLAHAILHAEYDGQRLESVLDLDTLVQSTYAHSSRTSPNFPARLRFACRLRKAPLTKDTTESKFDRGPLENHGSTSWSRRCGTTSTSTTRHA